MSESTEVVHDYTDGKFQPPTNYRVVDRPKPGGTRYYLTRREIDGEERFDLIIGTTSMMKVVFGTPKKLLEWMTSFPGGPEEAKAYGLRAADYGSAMHGMVSEVVREAFEDDNAFESMFRVILAGYEREDHFDEWIDKAKKNMMSWLQWVQDYEVRFIFCEMPLVSFVHGIAGQIDCLCEMNARKYTEKTPAEKRKRIIAMPDWKFGTSIEYREYAWQLGLYYAIIRENYPGLVIDKFYNWKPNDWRGETPTYTFKEKGFSSRSIEAILDLWAEESVTPPMMSRASGGYRIGEVPTLEKIPAVDFYAEQWKQRQDEAE